MSKRTNLSADLVFKTYLTTGIVGVKALVANHKDPRKLIAKAANDVEAIPGFDVEPLNMLLVELNAAKRKGGSRGLKPVSAGQSRSYKAQLNKKTGQLFLIVPLPDDVISVTQGDKVEARFENGKITLS